MPAFVPSQADADVLAVALRAVFPWSDVERSTLGGEHRASLMVRVSLDAPEAWANGILHNSRYGMFRIDAAGVEHFARSASLPKMRKAKADGVDAAFVKLQAWAAKV